MDLIFDDFIDNSRPNEIRNIKLVGKITTSESHQNFHKILLKLIERTASEVELSNFAINGTQLSEIFEA